MTLVGCVSVGSAEAAADSHELEGYASWYAGKFQGRLTASGEVFDTNLFTAAHKTLPFGTVVEVTHLGNGRSVEVRINDRGPFVEGRVIDLSRAAAEQIDMTAEGIARVRLRIVATPAAPSRTIQIASFGSLRNAERTRDRIRAESLEALIEPAGAHYRVVIAGVPDADVDRIVDRLAELGYVEVLIRTE